MVVKMSSSNGGSLALAGSEAGSGTVGSGPETGTGGTAQAAADSNHSEDEHGGDLVSSNDSDSMGFDDDDNGSDLMSTATLGDDITAQLAAAGPVGMAAAAAIASSKKRKRPHSFETNPSIRRRQQTRLLRKLRQTIDEYATRVGQQAVVLIATPGKPQNNFRVFGAKPLEDVIKNIKCNILQDLETALAHHAPPPTQDDPSLYELPPLVIDGIPTPVEKMTQAQLRAFIPLMLKFSTGRGKPGWGKESTRPPWWPSEVPWANVRMDARSDDDKQRVSWTHALRQIVINCYKYHGREDLLPAFSEDEETSRPAKVIKTEVDIEQEQNELQSQQQQQPAQQIVQPPTLTATSASTTTTQYAPTVVQTISNPDGTVSIIQVDPHSFTNSFLQVDPNNPIITLPDGTTAQVQGVATFVPTSQLTGVSSEGVTTLTGGPDGTTVTTVDLTAVTESTIGQEGHILLTGEDGQTYPVSVSGMITVPAMYQAVVANISQLQGQTDASVQSSVENFQHRRFDWESVVGPLLTSLPKVDTGGNDDGVTASGTNVGMNVGTLAVTPVLAVGPNGTQHILQVTAAPMVTSQIGNGQEVDTSILASAMQQVTSTEGEITADSSPSSSSE